MYDYRTAMASQDGTREPLLAISKGLTSIEDGTKALLKSSAWLSADAKRTAELIEASIDDIKKYVSRLQKDLQAKAKVKVPRVPVGPSGWSLYQGRPSANQAAKEITEGAMKAAEFIKMLARQGQTDAQDAAKTAYFLHIDGLLEMWSNTGANDTEPREIAFGYLLDVARYHGML